MSRTMWLNIRIWEPPVLVGVLVSEDYPFKVVSLHFLEGLNDFRILFGLDLLLIFGILGFMRKSPDLEPVFVKREVADITPAIIDGHFASINCSGTIWDIQGILFCC